MPSTHMICLNPIAGKGRCGHINRVSEPKCVNSDCERSFPNATTPPSTEFPKDILLLVERDKERDWFCMRCWAQNPPNTATCKTQNCAGLSELDGVNAHETFYIEDLVSHLPNQ